MAKRTSKAAERRASSANRARAKRPVGQGAVPKKVQALARSGAAAGDLPPSYTDLLTRLTSRIRDGQVRAAMGVNRELVLLNWELGRQILQWQSREGWGADVVGRLSRDLSKTFPGTRGFSPRNLKYMRAFADAYRERQIVQALAQITWFHNITLLEKVREPDQRLWYAQQAFKHGWSRNVLVHQIESGLYKRQGRAITNFDRTLPRADSDLVQQLIRDPMNLEFITLGPEARERELERRLIQDIKRFLLELGAGFAFVGSQYRLEVADKEYFLDLLFYHVHLHRYIVVDLKVEEFKPEFAGKMNLYLSAVDDQLRHPRRDDPSIGILLCKSRSHVVVEYALRDVKKPIGVAEYRIRRQLPVEMRNALPSPESIEAELKKKTNF